MTQLIDFTSFIQHYQPSTTESDLDAWKIRLDIDSYMRSMVMEWLTNNWDADIYCKLHITTQNFTMKSASRTFKFYSAGKNLAMYNNPDTHQYVYIPFNFDNTFGNGLEQDQGRLVTGSYEEFHNDNGKIHSYLWEKLAKMPSFKAMYEGITKDSLKTMFNSNALEPRIKSISIHASERNVMGYKSRAGFNWNKQKLDWTCCTAFENSLPSKEKAAKQSLGLLPPDDGIDDSSANHQSVQI